MFVSFRFCMLMSQSKMYELADSNVKLLFQIMLVPFQFRGCYRPEAKYNTC